MERFRKLNEIDCKKYYRVEISDSFSAEVDKRRSLLQRQSQFQPRRV
jgi:hypothetical protein